MPEDLRRTTSKPARSKLRRILPTFTSTTFRQRQSASLAQATPAGEIPYELNGA